MPTRLLEWCEEHDCTITDIADLSGYSVAYISLLSRDKRDAPPRVKVAIARALRARIRDLFPIDPEEAA